MAHLTQIVLSVVAGVITYYICKMAGQKECIKRQPALLFTLGK